MVRALLFELFSRRVSYRHQHLNFVQKWRVAEMVQVDVLWSYGIGASMALAAGRQLRARREIADAEREAGEQPQRLPGDPSDRASLWRNPFFLATVLYAALLFAPSGAYLLWEFPDWETMHAGDRDLPGLLVVGFAATNVAQAMLGFAVVNALLARGRAYAAYLQVLLAYLGMLFILVHGWDGKGYQRFFSPDRADYLAWDGDWSAWLTSDVALSLYAMGVVLIPVLLGTIARWTLAGYELAGPGERRPSAVGVVAVHLATVFVAGLGLAVTASLAIHVLGAALGIPAALLLAVVALLPGGPAAQLFGLLGLQPPRPQRAGHRRPLAAHRSRNVSWPRAAARSALSSFSRAPRGSR
jgi:hypothetical protein